MENKFLDEIKQVIVLGLLKVKNVLTFEETSVYMGVSKSHLYKLTMSQEIPHYKPRGKMLYFDRAEVDDWLLQNRVSTTDEIEVRANTYVTLNKK